MVIRLAFIGAVALGVSTLVACAGAPSPDASGTLRVVATTTIVGDVVRNVGGDGIALEVLLPPDSDPHGFQASPQDMVTLSEADVVFVNGLGLETFLEPILESAADPGRIVSVSEGVEVLPAQHADDHGHVGESHDDAESDPHVWLDPTNVIVWADNIARALAERDPAGASVYAANAAAYRAVLEDLDGWIREQVEAVPPARRLLVSDHRTFAYFARRYGFEDAGTVFPTTSTLAEPSAGELAQLQRSIQELGAPAVFVGTTVSARLAERVASDTGARLVRLYTGALSAADGPAPTYERMMRYDVEAIVGALR